MSTKTTSSKSSTPSPKSSRSTSYSPQQPSTIDDSKIIASKQSEDNKQQNLSLTDTCKFQVFLGGSCNPTTWRRNVAIPYLEFNGISYYNPQVENWTPDAVSLERSAKQNAQLLLYVIDKQTRSTVSIVESAFIAGEKKNLVLVLYPFDCNIFCLTDTKTQSNIKTRSKHTTTSSTSSRPINHNLHNHHHHEKSSSSSLASTTSSTLLSATTQKHKSNSIRTQLEAAASSTKTTLVSSKIISEYAKVEKCDVDERSLERMHHEANVQASGSIRMSGELISSREYLELRQARYILENLIALQKIPIFSDISQGLKYLTCCFANDRSIDSNKLHQQYKSESEFDLSSRLNLVLDLNKKQNKPMKDVYLSLDSDDYTNVESTVLPILKEKGLTFNYIPVNNALRIDNNDIITSSAPSTTQTNNQSLVLPKFPITITKVSLNNSANTNTNTRELQHQRDLSSYSELSESATTSSSSSSFDLYEKTKLALEKEICAIRSSRILLFVITNKCRGLSIMVLASHFMALFRNNVVLCLQYLEEPCSIGGETLSETAIADYNRGRVYLSDYAAKSQVPVFSTIQEAVDCCSRKCRYYNNKDNN